MKKKIVQQSLTLLFLTSILFLASCANIISPTGGPKDEIPPQLIDSLSYPNQKNNTNRSGSNILLIFDETTEVVSLKTQLVATPSIDANLVKYKTKGIKLTDTSGKTYKSTAVYINLNQTLDSNTTYVLNFGRSFKDINEGKTANNISIAFSTGNIIDSLLVKGKLRYNTTGRLGKELIIGLYTINDTSNAINSLPKYYTGSDESGNFKINYIKNDVYRLACFNDKNRNKKYDEGTEYIAFYPHNIQLDSAFDVGDLLLFKEDQRKPAINTIEIFNDLAKINFNKPTQTLEVKNYLNMYPNFNKTRKNLTICK